MPTRINDPKQNDLNQDGSEEIWELLNVYADGEATPEQIRRVEALLQSDAAYARQITFMRTAGDALRTITEVEPPVALRSAILASTTQRTTWYGRATSARDALLRLLTPRYSTSLMGLAAAGLLVFAVTHHSRRSAGTTTVAMIKGMGASVLRHGSDFTENTDTTLLSLAAELPAISPDLAKPVMSAVMHAPAPDLQSGSRRSPLVASNTPTGPTVPVQPGRHDDSGAQVVQAVYSPGMDDQFQRSGRSMPDNPPVELPGDDVHIADADAPPAVKQPGSAAESSTTTSAAPKQTGPHITYARLTALPPDANQVLTKADMDRNRAALPSGYDRQSLRMMEHKEASLSILKGTF